MIGSIPTGYLLAKHYYNIDIRSHGSGNIGSTNMRRILGNKIAVITQILDITKGLIPNVLGLLLYSFTTVNIPLNIYLAIIALASILGHNFTPFLNFKGGKGVNTTLGAFFLIAPIPVLSSVLIYFLLKPVTKIVAIRSIVLGISIPLLCAILSLPSSTVAFTSIAALLLIFQHRTNIAEIINTHKS